MENPFKKAVENNLEDTTENIGKQEETNEIEEKNETNDIQENTDNTNEWQEKYETLNNP